VCSFEKIRRERGGGKGGGREKMRGVLNKFFDDKAESPLLEICNNQPINETDSESPEGEKDEELDNMEEAFASAKKDERGPLEVSIGEIGGRGPNNGVNVVDNFSGFRADEKEMSDTILSGRLTKGTREVRRENRGISVIPGKETEPSGRHKSIMYQLEKKFQDVARNPAGEVSVCFMADGNLSRI
jgi:hypothetical protein